MPNYTPNYNLVKPLQTEYYNVGNFNENADKIDTNLKTIETNLTASIENIVVDVTKFGAVPDNSSRDSTSAIQDAYSTLRSGDTLLIPSGSFYITNLVFDKSDVQIECNGTLIQYSTATGSAVRFGTSARNTNRVNARIRVSKQTDRNWAQNNVGVELVNSNEFNIEIYALNFTKNVLLRGDNGGTAYNTIYLQRVVNGKFNLIFETNNNGYVNENKFIGGRLAWFSEVTDPAKYHVYIPERTMNNNIFTSISMEAKGTGTLLYCNGSNNTFFSPRLESDAGVRAIEFGPDSIYNQVVYPYLMRDINNTAAVLDQGTRNHILDRDILSFNRTQVRMDNIKIKGSTNASNNWNVDALIDVSSRVTNNDLLFIGKNVANVRTSSISGLGDVLGRGVGIQTTDGSAELFKIMRVSNEAVFTGNAKASTSYASNTFVPFAVNPTDARPVAVTPVGTTVFNPLSKKLYVSMGNGNYIRFSADEEG